MLGCNILSFHYINKKKLIGDSFRERKGQKKFFIYYRERI